jgi:hypothetical protein
MFLAGSGRGRGVERNHRGSGEDDQVFHNLSFRAAE